MGATEAVVESISTPMYQLDQNEFDLHMVDVRAQLEDVQFRAAWSDGQSMSLEEAIEYAMTPLSQSKRVTEDTKR